MHNQALVSPLAGEVARLLDTTLREEPPTARPHLHPSNRRRLRLGGYLLSYGYLTPAQLMRALAAQRRRPATGGPLFFGDLVVNLRYTSPRVVTTMLVVQLLDQLAAPPSRPDRLGERLVLAGLLRPAQLAAALQQQIHLRSRGQQAPLGSLLVQQRLVSPQQVQRVLLAVAEDRFAAVGDLGLPYELASPAQWITLRDEDRGQLLR